jgi:hypothetical protein
MLRRLSGIAVACTLVLAFGVSTAEAQLLSSRPLAVPVTGSIAGGGSFVGTLSIQRFAAQGSATVAIAAIAGAIVNAPGLDGRTGIRANVALPVTVNAALPIAYQRPGDAFGARLVRASQTCGGGVNIQIGGAAVNVMGVQVMLNPAMVDVGADAGGLIGSLVCQVVGLLGNPTLLVGVLNQLLAQVVGLTGGIGGGLLL